MRWIVDLEERVLTRYRDAINEMVLAHAARNGVAAEAAFAHLQQAMTLAMGVSEVLGATIGMQQAAGVYADSNGASRRFAAERNELLVFVDSDAATLLPRVEFDESIRDMIDRTPTTLRGAAVRVGEEIARLYSSGHVVAFARAVEQTVTEKVQSLIIQGMREGWAEGESGSTINVEVAKLVEASETWTDSYSRMVFRTNVSTAVNAGRFRQAQDPDVAHVVPAMRFDAVGDSDTRPNHGAADGRIWSTTNPVWHRLAPPLGYNCRCGASLVTRPELERMGRIRADGSVIDDAVPPGAFPDPGFRHAGRPDLGF